MNVQTEREVMAVRELEGQDYTGWDSFVLSHPCGSPFHLTAWKESIEATFGYRSMSLIAMRGGQVCGVLPLFLVSSIVTGKRLISSPFAVYGGILADSEESKLILLERAKQMGQQLGVP